jgi:excisionase family DNA binding protein
MVEESHYVRRVTRTIESPDFSRREAAVYIGMSVRTVDRLREDGEIESFLQRASVRIPKSSLDAYRDRERLAAQRARERAHAPRLKDDFDTEVPYLKERRARRAA